MKSCRPFRILIIEDDEDAIKPLINDVAYRAGSEFYFLERLRSVIGEPGEHTPIEVYWSQTIHLSQKHLAKDDGDPAPVASESKNSVFRVFPPATDGEEERALLFDNPDRWAALKAVGSDNLSEFLKSMDIVILDLAVSGTLLGFNAGVVTKNFGALSVPSKLDELIESAGKSFPGIAFYHTHLEDLRSVQLVVILSNYDEGAAGELPIKELIHPFCGLQEHIPFTVKYGKAKLHAEGKNSSLHSRIECLYRDYCEGYTQLRNLGQIELAANHDFPVMIVGESGSGKEYVAGAIHRRWLAERRRSQRDIEDNFVVVNCAGLSSELARSELFGHVAGSFTGATDHRIGAILKACGCRGFKKTTAGEARKFEEAKHQAEDLAESVAIVLKERDAKKKYEHFESQLLPNLTAAIDFEHNSLVSVLKTVQKKLENAAHGDDLVQDYHTGLTETNNANLERLKTGDEHEYLGVKFKHEQPVGTLFLDEFGDLPLEVQNLLLRFLEEKSGEIHPVGYPGRIAGIKIRLILATSDPRIAKFAGYELLGADRSRSDQEMARSLRHDLLFRVKGQVIRTEAIKTRELLWASLEEMIDRHSNPEWTWADEAKEYLAGVDGEITKILTALAAPTDDSNASRFMVFGQRRELKRIIDLANAYMESAERRGQRLNPNEETKQYEITKQIVQEVWRPSELLMTKPVPTAAVEKSNQTAGSNLLSQELTAEEVEIRNQILNMLDNKQDLLSAEPFRKHVQGLDENKRNALKDKLEQAVGLTSAGKNQKPAKYQTIGRIFKYDGKSKSTASSPTEYGRQTGEWWRTQVFKPKDKSKQ